MYLLECSRLVLSFLAHSYRYGIGVAENTKKALTLYHCAALLPDGEYANYWIGEMYSAGEGVRPNTKKAIHHFSIVVNDDDSDE